MISTISFLVILIRTIAFASCWLVLFICCGCVQSSSWKIEWQNPTSKPPVKHTDQNLIKQDKQRAHNSWINSKSFKARVDWWPPGCYLSLLGSHEWGGGCLFFSEAAYQQVLTKSILCLNYVTSLSDIEIDLGMFALQKNHCQQRWIDGNMMKYLWNIWNWQGWWIGFIHAPRQAPLPNMVFRTRKALGVFSV